MKGKLIMGESWNAGNYDESDFDSIDEAYDWWDVMYGEGTFDYEAYVLCDTSKKGNYKFGPLEFRYKPIYVGHGKSGRAKRSCNISLYEMAVPKTLKQAKLKELAENKVSIRFCIIGRFQTKKKAEIVEKKLLTLIPKEYLCKSLYHLCTIPLQKQDYEFYNRFKNLYMKG